MLYSSRNGCFYYYDSVLFRWQVAEPTLLFLLGLESVTTFDKSISDSITISKYVYQSYIDSVTPLEYITDIYDDIYSFLSKIGSVEDHETYLKFNCYGLKLLLNSITGISVDRTIPVIFKSDVNRYLFNNNYVTSGLSYYDSQAKKIYDIFNDIDYDTRLDGFSSGSPTPDYLISRDTHNISHTLDLLSFLGETLLRNSIVNNITAYNNKVNSVHASRLSNSEIYRLLDNKAMYAYSLGVLFGCRCLGFDDSIIWRIDPKIWYNGVYYNLVRTAWYVFRFHWCHTLNSDTLSNNYQSIQDNKIWNFVNDSSLIDAPLAKDETDCFCLYLNNNKNSPDYLRTKSESIIYSNITTTEAQQSYPGSYLLKYMSLKDGHVTWKWSSIDKKVSDEEPLKGVISSQDSYMTRYIGNDPVIIYRAYKYKQNDTTCYLAPKYIDDLGQTKYKKYYIYTGDIGWVDYEEDLIFDYKHFSYGYEHSYLNIVPTTPSFESLKYAFPLDNTDNPPKVITYFKCYVIDDRYVLGDLIIGPGPGFDLDRNSVILYGIYDSIVLNESSIPTNFDHIISKDLFDLQYASDINLPYGDQYKTLDYYDVNSVISLIVQMIDGVPYVYDLNTRAIGKSVHYYGYSDSPSSYIALYNLYDETNDLDYPHEEIFRYYTVSNNSSSNADRRYWSSDYFIPLDGDLQINRTWRYLSELQQLADFRGNSLYSLANKVINLYRGEIKVVSNLTVYNNYINKLYALQSILDEYVYIKSDYLNTLDEISTQYSFTLVGNYKDTSQNDSLYLHGITTHVCKYILEDDNGESLLDNKTGIPLVWLDPETNMYWNGLDGLNVWQNEKPYIII